MQSVHCGRQDGLSRYNLPLVKTWCLHFPIFHILWHVFWDDLFHDLAGHRSEADYLALSSFSLLTLFKKGCNVPFFQVIKDFGWMPWFFKYRKNLSDSQILNDSPLHLVFEVFVEFIKMYIISFLYELYLLFSCCSSNWVLTIQEFSTSSFPSLFCLMPVISFPCLPCFSWPVLPHLTSLHLALPGP